MAVLTLFLESLAKAAFCSRRRLRFSDKRGITLKVTLLKDAPAACSINPAPVHVLAAPKLSVSTAAKAGSQTAAAIGASGHALS